MGKGANKDLLQNSGTANNMQKQLAGQASTTYGQLDPMLLSEATNPQGYGAGGLAAMNTAGQQSNGGATSAVTGTSNLEAARTRNAGGFQGAIGTGSRAAMKQNSENAVTIQAQNAQLKEAQKQQALSSLQSLYGVDQGTALNYLNSSNSALNGENAGTASWLGLEGNLAGDLTKLAQPFSQAAANAVNGGSGGGSGGG